MRGGKRVGAGAKPLRGVRKVGISLGVTPLLRDWLSEIATESETSISEAVESALRATPKFKRWAKR